MARFHGRSVAALLAVFAVSNALAQPVTLSVTSGTASITSQTQSNGAWTVLIHVTAGSPAVFTVTTATSNVVVEKIEVECDADCLMTVDESGSGSFAEVQSIVEKSTSSPESFEIFRIQASGALGPGDVSAEVIDEINVGGDLTATVTAGPRADNSDSDISLIDVGGDIYHASIKAIYGSIGQILVGGSIEGVLSGFASPIHARDGIREIEADSITTTDIWANYTEISAPLSTGAISRVEVRDDGMFNTQTTIAAYGFKDSGLVAEPGIFINGDMEGVLSTQTALEIPIEITGDLSGAIKIWQGGTNVTQNTRGDITIHGNMDPDSYIFITSASNDPGYLRTLIRVGGSFGGLTDSASITVKALHDTTAGQVIFNAYDNAGEWGDGDVIVDSTTLSPVPAYANEDLIGAVGEVPFRLHDGDCIPENAGVVYPNDGLLVLRFYGPVTWDEGFPLNVSWCPGGSSCDPVSENQRWSVAAGRGTRTIYLPYVDNSQTPAAIPAGRSYTILPVLTGGNALLCDKLLTTDDVPAADFTFTFVTP